MDTPTPSDQRKIDRRQRKTERCGLDAASLPTWEMPVGFMDSLAMGLLRYYSGPRPLFSTRRRRMKKRLAKKICMAMFRDPRDAVRRYSREQRLTAHKTLVREHNRQKRAEWEALSEDEKNKKRTQAMIQSVCGIGATVGIVSRYLKDLKAA